MYTLYWFPAAFYECLITVMIKLCTTATQKMFPYCPLGDINIFTLHGVFLSTNVQLRRTNSFSNKKKKKSAVKSETHFSREAAKN